MPKLRPTLDTRIPMSTEVVPPKAPHRFEKGHKRIAGRERGTPNIITNSAVQSIFQGWSRAGGGGPDGIARYVCEAARKDYKFGIGLLSLLVPKQVHADIHRTEVQLLSIEDVDRSLIASGLPAS